MTQHLIQHHPSPFDGIKRVEQGREYWSARDLRTLMGYIEWRKFTDAIERTRLACHNSGQGPSDHFVLAAKMVSLGKGAPARGHGLSPFPLRLLPGCHEQQSAQSGGVPDSDQLRGEELEIPNQERIKYLHLCPTGRAVWAWAYPNTYLTTFTKWLWGQYFPTHFSTYQYHRAQFVARHRTLPAQRRKKSLRCHSKGCSVSMW